MDVKEELAETEPGEVFKLKQEVVGGGVEKSVDEMDVEDGSDFLACLRMLSEDKRVDMNIKNSNGNTPLMYCLKTGRVEMARLLLQDPRVDLDTTDKEGNYPENIARFVFYFIKSQPNDCFAVHKFFCLEGKEI